MSDLKVVIGAKVRELRKAKSISQVELGDKIGMTQSYIGQIERGELNISLDTLDKITLALDVSMVELLRLETIKLDKLRLDKEAVIKMLQDLLIQRSIEEIKMIYRISNDILVTNQSEKGK